MPTLEELRAAFAADASEPDVSDAPDVDWEAHPFDPELDEVSRRAAFQQQPQTPTEKAEAARSKRISEGKPFVGRVKVSRDGSDAVLEFGTHRGKTISALVDEQPGYVNWMRKDETCSPELADVIDYVLEGDDDIDIEKEVMMSYINEINVWNSKAKDDEAMESVGDFPVPHEAADHVAAKMGELAESYLEMTNNQIRLAAGRILPKKHGKMEPGVRARYLKKRSQEERACFIAAWWIILNEDVRSWVRAHERATKPAERILPKGFWTGIL